MGNRFFNTRGNEFLCFSRNKTSSSSSITSMIVTLVRYFGAKFQRMTNIPPS